MELLYSVQMKLQVLPQLWYSTNLPDCMMSHPRRLKFSNGPEQDITVMILLNMPALYFTSFVKIITFMLGSC